MTFPTDNVFIDPVIGQTTFACDLQACRGACCTLPGGRGAPLLDEEAKNIADVLPVVLPSLPKEHRQAIETHGAIEGPPGDYHTTCVDQQACVFVRYERSVAVCSIEDAYNRSTVTWRKPLSCHLFPIRIDSGAPMRVRFEYIPECLPAIRRGREEGIPLISFVSEALYRAFGQTWSSLKERLKQ